MYSTSTVSYVSEVTVLSEKRKRNTYPFASHSSYLSNRDDCRGDVTPTMLSPRRFDSDFSSRAMSFNLSGHLRISRCKNIRKSESCWQTLYKDCFMRPKSSQLACPLHLFLVLNIPNPILRSPSSRSKPSTCMPRSSQHLNRKPVGCRCMLLILNAEKDIYSSLEVAPCSSKGLGNPDFATTRDLRCGRIEAQISVFRTNGIKGRSHWLRYAAGSWDQAQLKIFAKFSVGWSRFTADTEHRDQLTEPQRSRCGHSTNSVLVQGSPDLHCGAI